MMTTAQIGRCLRADNWAIEPVGGSVTATSTAGMPEGTWRRIVLNEDKGGWGIYVIEYRDRFGNIQIVNRGVLRFADKHDLLGTLATALPPSVPVKFAVAAPSAQNGTPT